MKIRLVKLFVVTFLTSFTFSLSSQVEVRSTSPNSILDINSPNKAVLLPRVNTTDLVNSPEEGLFVYNKASQSPSYHDGTQWNNMGSMMMPVSDIDSLTYTIISGYGPPFGTGTFDLVSFQASGSSFEVTEPGIFNMTKENDARSRGFMQMLFDQTTNNSVSIEVKVYKKEETTPYFSYKITNLSILAYGYQSTKGATGLIENYTISAKVFGFKDEASGNSIAWDTTTDSIVPY